MAFRDGRPAGRIAGIINHQVNADSKRHNARFGFVDFIDDVEVSEALFKAVEDWARTRGVKRLIGPLGFTDLDREGMLVEGFQELSTMATIYNYPYYPAHLERLGFRKESDWVEFVMDVPDSIPEKYSRIADIVSRKYGLRTVKYSSRKRLKDEYGRALFHLINEAYEGLYEYSKLSERRIDYYISLYLNLLNLDLVSLVVDSADRLVGVGISMQSVSRALREVARQDVPHRVVPSAQGLKGKNDRVDFAAGGRQARIPNKGVNALLFTDLIPQYIKHGYRWAESNPELETNSKVQGQWEYFGNRQHRRRRSFSKDI